MPLLTAASTTSLALTDTAACRNAAVTRVELVASGGGHDQGKGRDAQPHGGDRQRRVQREDLGVGEGHVGDERDGAVKDAAGFGERGLFGLDGGDGGGAGGVLADGEVGAGCGGAAASEAFH